MGGQAVTPMRGGELSREVTDSSFFPFLAFSAGIDNDVEVSWFTA